ncbi:MAG TPA: ABC transporter substrate-binding protein, partial [Candidatus Thioglobus sp.]|nr:ABC transporter substrate-binding protein [Candidatus Thioglobus sp.]
MKQRLLYVAILSLFTGAAQAASCPAVTVADDHGVPSGAYPQQYELAEFQSLANCTLSFSTNPDSAALNNKIRGNPALPGWPITNRLPSEPLVYAPYDSIGKYGGTLDVLSN